MSAVLITSMCLNAGAIFAMSSAGTPERTTPSRRALLARVHRSSLALRETTPLVHEIRVDPVRHRRTRNRHTCTALIEHGPLQLGRVNASHTLLFNIIFPADGRPAAAEHATSTRLQAKRFVVGLRTSCGKQRDLGRAFLLPVHTEPNR